MRSSCSVERLRGRVRVTCSITAACSRDNSPAVKALMVAGSRRWRLSVSFTSARAAAVGAGGRGGDPGAGVGEPVMPGHTALLGHGDQPETHPLETTLDVIKVLQQPVVLRKRKRLIKPTSSIQRCLDLADRRRP